MQSIRLSATDDPMFHTAMALYATSFPAHEQRASASQRAIIHCTDYHFDLLYDESLFVGIILYWETAAFLYVEHFCIDTEQRGKRYGEQALAHLHEKGKAVILEIDPPVDTQSIRRKSFYERIGYCENPYQHVHPPYHQEHEGHALVVMSYPAPLPPTEYDRFSRYLTDQVMGQ